MSAISASLRWAVVQRAEDRCEYCRLPALGQVATFPIDHVVPLTRQGVTDLSNLALACPHCNAHKWAHVDGSDSETGTFVALFNPRTQNWNDHLEWSTADERVGKSAAGRATIWRLQMNSGTMLEIRRLLRALGIVLSTK